MIDQLCETIMSCGVTRNDEQASFGLIYDKMATTILSSVNIKHWNETTQNMPASIIVHAQFMLANALYNVNKLYLIFTEKSLFLLE